jgi:hypothetical protein
VDIPGINSVGKQFMQKQAESLQLLENPFHQQEAFDELVKIRKDELRSGKGSYCRAIPGF